MRLTLAAALALLLGAQAPELTTLLGRPVFARADTDGAIARADTALAADPRSIELFLAAARARDVALQFHAAIEVYTRGLAIAPDDARLLRFRGHRYISTRRFDLAATDLRRAAALAPSSFDVLYHLGVWRTTWPGTSMRPRACIGPVSRRHRIRRRCHQAGAVV